MKQSVHSRLSAVLGAFALAPFLLCAPAARGEAILQVFNQSHNEIAARLPEIAEAGYTALWVPPPTKANGGMSVGYDLNDPFDIGNSDLRGTWSTRYGVEADLHNLIAMCHRFGMRVYFDNVMNHRSYDVPGFNESTPTDVYPGMCPEDFHLRTTSDGFYRKWDNIDDWNNEWTVMYRPLSDLIDIAHENKWSDDGWGPCNGNFGANLGDWHLKPYIIRYAYHKEDTWKLFDRMPYPGTSNNDYAIGDGALQNFDSDNGRNLYTGFENRAWNPENPDTAALISANAVWFDEHDARNGVSMKLIEDFPNFYKEKVDDYLYRAVRWLVDTTHVDGLRLDAVKHVPYDFFGAAYGDDKNSSNYGYTGQAQWQFNMTRGFNDWWDHRNSVFNTDDNRDDLMMFGEHLGNPPPQGPYIDAGMRLVDDRLRNELNWRFSANDLTGFDNEYAGSDLGPYCGVMHAQSHDNDYVDRKPLHHAMYFMRRGLGLVYSDGNNHAATLSGSGGAFPRWACTDFLGQWGQKQIPTLLHAHENFARYDQIGKWSQGNFVAFQRGGGYDPDGGKHWETMIFQLNSLWDEWDYAHTAGDFPSDAYLYDYASDYDPYMPHNDNDTGWPACPYAWAGEIASTVKLPGNSYAIWSWKNPDPSGLYPSPYPECFANTDDRIISPDSRVITIFEDGKIVDPVMVTRKDGVDGDPNFNPYNVADTNATDYAYTIAIPRVTKGTDVTLAVKADGSAETLMLRLDGGMDFGNHDHTEEGDWRDNPPGGAHDFYLGFEDTDKWFTRRIWSEKFAAADTTYCKIGTQGATTYEITPSAANVYQPESQYDGPSIRAPGFVYHNPSAMTDPVPADGASVSSIGPRGKGKAAAKSAAPADGGASVSASAEWIGATYIFANGWYKGDGQTAGSWEPVPGAFHGADLGTVTNTLHFGGQAQTYGEGDGKGNPARACYNIRSGADIVGNGTCTLYWYDYKDNNNWFESRTGNEGTWKTLDIDLSDLMDGATYTLSVWFEANAASGNTYDNNKGANYEATFTVALDDSGGGGGEGGGDDPDPPSPADTRAAWIGKSYVNANGTWYVASGRDEGDPDKWWGDGEWFNGKNLGRLTSLVLGGQAQTYGESDGENHPAHMSWNILSGSDIVSTDTNTLVWYVYTNNNNYFQSGGGGDDFAGQTVNLSGLDDGTYKLSVWFWAEGTNGPVYDNNNGANYEATFTIGEGGGGGGGGGEDWESVPQFTRNGTAATVWVQTSHAEGEGLRAFLYYTVDGVHWPEGGGGVPANTATKAVEGHWKCNVENGTKSWWRFDIPEGSIPSGATLRYKVSAFLEMGMEDNGWGTIWPGDGNAVWVKKAMMSLWTVTGLNFETQQYHKHLDYNSWTTGFEDGFHLITARMFLPNGRSDWASPIANTFRQTFYLDRHVPEGRILYPANDGDDVGGNSYGCVVQTDDTVTKVYYHVTDSSTVNDGPGNGLNTNGVVEWAEATLAGAWSKEMATNTALPKVWKFNYTPAPESSEQAVIRVRLCEVSSTPTNGWSQADPAADDPDALHVKEIERKVWTHGPNYYVRFDWPVLTNDMVECGWELQLKYNWEFAAGLGDDEAKALFTFQFESPGEEDGKKIVVTNLVAGSDASVSHQWNHPHENGLKIALPNLFTGKEDDLHKVIVTGKREIDGILVEITTTNTFRTKGPLLPTCIVTTPPETDSDGVKWVITMEDSVAARTNRTLRETPIVVLTDAEATKLDITFVAPTGYDASISATPGTVASNEVLRLDSIADNGTSKTWTFAWQVTNAGSYRFQAVVTADNSSGKYSVATNSVVRSATVQFRQIIHGGAGDLDWDDDAIGNEDENETTDLPERTDETWTQDEVFAWWRSGKSDADCPDTDGDGLPDGLELGCRVAVEGTDAAMDTNGDGWPNFIGDIDPPFFNVLPNKDRFQTGVIDQAGTGADRTKRVVGSVTDPRATDSDYDGLPDGLEDANRNGWTDGDGNPFPTDYDPYPEHNWADGKMVGEVWEETSPCLADSDADGLSDGYGEDKNANGWTDMGLVYRDATNTVVPFTAEDYRRYGVDNASSANSSSTLLPKPYTSRAINYEALFAAYNVTDPNGSGTAQTNGWPRLVITETDPLCTDTDHDGLPDGWENNYSLDPLNNGVYDFRTGRFTDDPTHGPNGNPDGDTYIQGGEVVPYDNLAENLGGTNPRSSDNSSGGGGGGDPSGSITIGEGDVIGEVNGNKFFTEYTQWTLADLIALDDYNQGGNSSDIYRCWDGFDSSRDMVAFYFRDGGDRAEGGDGKLYFRIDFDDLQAFAEDGHLNVYVAMNYGSYGQEGDGIRWLPDDVNCETEMRWHAVVGVYDSQNGCVYVQDGKGSQDFLRCNDAFLGAYFNSQLDSVAWSVDRDTLRDKGVTWNGLSDNLLFQVYTTRDYTSDDGGSGDKGGLNDFTDTIGDDWLCSDYGNDWNYIHQYGKYSTCVTKANPRSGWNNRGQHAKLAIVAHGNQAVEQARDMHGLVDNGEGAGYQRPVKIHNIYTNCPMNLHITPTLAMAMEWAEVGNEKTWFSGAAFNEAIRAGIAKGAFALLGSTFSDHMIKYYPDAFNAANAKMAEDTLNAIYGNGEKVVSTNIFWLSERVADSDILQKLARMGYQATVVDQTPHLLDWFGRETALGSDAYKIQRYWAYGTDSTQGEEIKAFVLSSAADQFRFANTDSGFPVDLRHLFLRRARSSDKDVAISSLFYRWEDFTGTENSDNYDRNIRWIANHPWIQVVTLDKALEDEKLSNNLVWKDVCATNGMGMQDWVHHACNEDYDNWYYGSSRHESLADKVFEVRQGANLPSGTVYGDATNGIVKAAWDKVAAIANADVKRLAEATIFASAFETAFHIEDYNNLARWSFGEYMEPATGWHWNDAAQDWEPMGLMAMAWKAQSRTRLAAVFSEVDAWAAAHDGVKAYKKDVDLDGEQEWILRNDKVMALFEAEGGLMVGAWLKDGSNVWQVVGNFVAQPGSGYETMNTDNSSHRGAAMKDVSIGGSPMVATLFSATADAGTITFTGGGLTKTVSLANASTNAFAVSYSASGKQMYVRNGLSPDLATLMTTGQRNMSEKVADKEIEVTTASDGRGVTAKLTVSTGSINASASDKDADWNTVNMRNAAHVRQVEVMGTGSLAYTLAFSTEERSQEPPVLTVVPDQNPQVFAAGATNAFRVTVFDPDTANVFPAVDNLSLGGYHEASFDAGSGLFSWHVEGLSDGSRTNDYAVSVTFTATDGVNTTNRTVGIVVPWDSDGDGMADDWELVKFGDLSHDGTVDSDRDGMTDFAEYVAGTHPMNVGDYLGWESITGDGDAGTTTLTFDSVAGRTYEIQAVDGGAGLLAPQRWTTVSDPIRATSARTSWTDSTTNAIRMYRIKVVH